MNALKVKMNRAKRERQAAAVKVVQKAYNEIAQKNMHETQNRMAFNAQLHILHLFEVLHSEFGFGAKKLWRLLQAYNKSDPQFKKELEDGVAYTMIYRRLQAMKFPVDKLDWSEMEKMQENYEKDVIRKK